ncbi:MAG: hypothetical protein IJC71_05355, partial [Clostridia bacterium]|nr:hypothetical protein [Clostridia bacterium]
MNGIWDLSILYSGYDDPDFAADLAALDENIAAVNTFASELENYSDKDTVSTYLSLAEKQSYLASKLFIYANLRYSGNTADSESASMLGQLMDKMSATVASDTLIQSRIAAMPEAVFTDSSLSDEYRYLLNNIRRDAKYLLSEKEEALFAKMNISGASAWSDLQS